MTAASFSRRVRVFGGGWLRVPRPAGADALFSPQPEPSLGSGQFTQQQHQDFSLSSLRILFKRLGCLAYKCYNSVFSKLFFFLLLMMFSWF